jgi:hypothetical protein
MLYNMQAQAPVSDAAKRMRRSRARRRNGLRSLRIELHATEIDFLIAWGLLEEWRRDDQNAILKALYALFDNIFRMTRNVSTPR